uniref:Uncharacterized protein n=1 Tax=Arundo donax TaxID=35708 RepID=A0A0A9FZS2_ARUDO
MGVLFSNLYSLSSDQVPRPGSHRRCGSQRVVKNRVRKASVVLAGYVVLPGWIDYEHEWMGFLPNTE